MTDIPTEALEAAIEHVIFSKFTQTEHGPTCPVRSSVTRCNCEIRRTVTRAIRAAAPHLIAEGRRQALAEVERAGSRLCDCDDHDGSKPTNPRTGALMDHHCDCPAVEAAATMLGSYGATKHAQECEHDGR